MTTAYNLADTLPKDAGGQKVIAWVDVSTSQLDWSLTAGIGSKTTSSKIVSALWSGNGLAGCKIEPTGGVGNILMAHWSSAASPTATQNAIHLRANDRGEIYHSGLAMTVSAMNAASTETALTSSGILYRAVFAGCGVVAGAQAALLNNGASIGHVVFSGANETLTIDYGTGACFGGLKLEKRGTVGSLFATLLYKPFGQ